MNIGDAVEVGNRARHFQNAVVRARRKAEFLNRSFEHIVVNTVKGPVRDFGSRRKRSKPFGQIAMLYKDVGRTYGCAKTQRASA